MDLASNFDPLKPPKSLKNQWFFNDFGIFAGYCFHCSWKPTWLHFGVVLPPKLEPSWHQNALKTHPTTHQKKDRILNRLRTDFWWILASNLGSLGGPKFLFFGSWNHLVANLAPKTPKTPPRAPKTLPKSPQDAPRPPQEPIWNRFWAHFGRILVDFW